MADTDDVRINANTRCFEKRGWPHRAVRAVYSDGYFGKGVTSQQKCIGREYSRPSSARDHLSNANSSMSVLSGAENQEKTTAAHCSDDRRCFAFSTSHLAKRQMPDGCSSRQYFERHAMPLAGTDFSGNNREPGNPLISADMDGYTPHTTPDRYDQEQIYSQRLNELSRYQDLIEEARPFFTDNTLEAYIQEFLSGKRAELELSRLFIQDSITWPRVSGSTSGERSCHKKRTHLRMTPGQKEELKTILKSQNPSDFGINDSKWTSMNIRNLIKERFQLDYKVSNVRYIIHAMKMTLKSINGNNPSIPPG